MKARKRGTRDRVCAECGKVERVRADSAAVMCKSCASSFAGKKGVESQRRLGMKPPEPVRATPRLVCEQCGTLFHLPPSELAVRDRLFCSKACRSASLRVDRVCVCCSQTFSVLRSSLRGKTNASGNFCSRACYERWLCDGDRINGRGSRWQKIRGEVVAAFPFCGMCGTSRRLQVHHIVPWRVERDNSRTNLIPLCVKCHKEVEVITSNFVSAGFSPQAIKLILGRLLFGRLLATRSTILRVVNERKSCAA